jgi:5S rRNA maturation endonuclease (ribonuclease M5)
MTDPIIDIENALTRAGKRVVKRGDTLQAQCPAHPDSNPSLTISRGITQPVILHCHAGCDTHHILTALDLTWADINNPKQPDTPEQPITYTYTNPDGTPRYRVIRTPDKKFWQQAFNPETGEWENGIAGIERTLYRHPELIQAIADGKPIWIVEGEKDADRLHRHGHTATCNSGGAGKFTDDLADLLTEATYINIIADNDQPGIDHANHISQLCTDRGIRHDIWLPAEGKDISDHLNRQHPITALKPLTGTSTPADDLAHLINWDEFWTQTHDDEQWLAWPLIPTARTVSLYAPAKAGKSTILLSVITAACTGQQPLNNQHTPQQPVTILYLDYEMSTADLYERLTSLGYGPGHDLTRLHYALLPSLPPLDTPEGGNHLLQLAQQLQVDAVVVDTIGRAVTGEENSADTIRAFYRHTAQQLKQAGISVLRTDHSGKDADKGQRGTSAKNDDVDIVFKLTRNQTGVTLTRTHSRITWAPDNIHINYTETDEGTVTVELAATTVFPDGTAPIAKLLDDLNIPVDQSMRKTEKQVREAGHKIRNSLIRAAIQMRREKHLRDPFGLPDTRRKPVDNSSGNGAHVGAHPPAHDGAHDSGALGRTPTNPNEINGAHFGAHSGTPTESNRGAPRITNTGRTEDHDDELNLF